MRNREQEGEPGYGFIQFTSRAAAEHALSFNGKKMPSLPTKLFNLKWAHDGSYHNIFVSDLASDVTDAMLEEIFKAPYPSFKSASVVKDRDTGLSKGYGFVRFWRWK